MNNRPTMQQTFLEMAEVLSKRSSCSRLSVGCIITTTDYSKVLSVGYNGNAKGLANACETKEEGNCQCLHAELNACIKCSDVLVDKVVFTTTAPCKNCAKYLLNLGNVKVVYYLNDYRNKDGLSLLKQAHIDVYKYEHKVAYNKEELKYILQNDQLFKIVTNEQGNQEFISIMNNTKSEESGKMGKWENPTTTNTFPEPKEFFPGDFENSFGVTKNDYYSQCELNYKDVLERAVDAANDKIQEKYRLLGVNQQDLAAQRQYPLSQYQHYAINQSTNLQPNEIMYEFTIEHNIEQSYDILDQRIKNQLVNESDFKQWNFDYFWTKELIQRAEEKPFEVFKVSVFKK